MKKIKLKPPIDIESVITKLKSGKKLSKKSRYVLLNNYCKELVSLYKEYIGFYDLILYGTKGKNDLTDLKLLTEFKSLFKDNDSCNKYLDKIFSLDRNVIVRTLDDKSPPPSPVNFRGSLFGKQSNE